MARRTLALRREALSELATDELANIVGGQVPITPTTPILQCLISTLPCGGPPSSQVCP